MQYYFYKASSNDKECSGIVARDDDETPDVAYGRASDQIERKIGQDFMIDVFNKI